MPFVSDLGGSPIIDDSNFRLYADQVADPNQPFSGGFIKRDYTTHGLGTSYSGPRYPESDWPAMIQEKEERKSSLTDLHLRSKNKVMDQNGLPYCATAETEVLTDSGWKKWPDVGEFDLLATINPVTHMMEFQRPLARQILEHKGELVCSTNRRVKFAMTGQHRMYVRRWDESKRTLSSQYDFVEAQNLGWYSGLLSAPRGHRGTDLVEVEIEGDRCYDGDDFFAMLSLIISCGYAGGSDKTRDWVSFCCFDDARYSQVASLASRVGFKEQPGRRGVWTRYSSPALADWVRNNCYSHPELGAKNKQVPAIVKVASGRQIKHFLLNFGDQDRKNPLTRFDTSSWQLVGGLQELLLRIGLRSTPSERREATSCMQDGTEIKSDRGWRLVVGQTDRLCLDRKKHIESDRYNGLVYCATVPNGTLVTRYEGTTLISGNCWMYGTVGAMKLAYAQQGVYIPDLSPTSAASRGKNYREQGGWAEEALGYIDKLGVATCKFWPEHQNDRRHDTPEMRTNAMQHRVAKGGYEELTSNNFAELVCSLLDNNPTTLGLTWWGHLVFGLRPVVIERGSIGIEILNSWGLRWENQGRAVLRREKATAHEQIAIRRVTPVRQAA